MKSFLKRMVWSSAWLGLPFTVSAYAAEPLPVVASFSILGDLVAQVGGERVHVSTLVGAGQDAHIYQPTPQDVKTLSQAKMFVVNGLGFEGWLERLQSSSGYRGMTVVVSDGAKVLKVEGTPHHHHDHGHDHKHGDEHHHDHAHDHHHHGDLDPHAWHDVDNVAVYVQNIAMALSKIDPDGRAYYQQRSTEYQGRLKALDHELKQAISAVPVSQRRVITGHDAFAYLGRRYQIRFMSPQGVSTEAEASAAGVAALVRQIRQRRVRALFTEDMSDSRVLQQIARETGVGIGGKLYSDALSQGAPAGSYVDLMKYNMNTLVNGIKASHL